jgi:hypothetical protein|tara:strand:+ start:1452 stop:1835 length:384 start_codon:yes stop_codon:yes gene_type:complete
VKTDKAAKVIVELAQEFISGIQRISPTWKQAYWRFESQECRFGSNASVVTHDEVLLVDPFREKALFEALNSLGRRLWELESARKKEFCVCLLRVENTFDYDIAFEREDPEKWRITKLDGNSGIPEGV